jgi:hypothetical protein
MAETLVIGGTPEAAAIPPSAEVRAMAAGHAGPTAVEQLLVTEPAAVFEWPAGMTGNRGVTYTAPSGDA